MRCEVVAVGTELLLGQIVDTNSAWIGEQLAAAGIDSLHQTKVGDNLGRIVGALRAALARSDAVICCGGLGPTQDDITREAIAEVLGVPLEVDDEVAARISEMFSARGRAMAANNLRQAEVPRGATVIPQLRGTAPGLIGRLGDRRIYAVPGVPHEMREMITRAVIPDLIAQSGEVATIFSRTLRTWGIAESALDEQLAGRMAALDGLRADGRPAPTIAFLASGIEGIKVRITAKAGSAGDAAALVEAEEAEVRALLGPAVFGVDEIGMEAAVGRLLVDHGLTLGVAESLTGGLVGSRITAVAGASGWFRGSLVVYASSVKRSLLGVGDGPVVSESAAVEMAAGAARVLGADVGLALTGVAGPDEQDGQPVGTVWVGLSGDAVGGDRAHLLQMGHYGGDAREQIRQMATISALDLVRRRLMPG
ncbi:MAG TPA: competence/damage-inducible protein A [Acidimicrobiales bacterium]|nr:competence/damage-inducible protein A [Acidimicrobiales bacterium]